MKKIKASFKEQVNNLLLVSIAYITAFSLSLGFIFPLQKTLLAGLPITVWMVFLPHGVRVLSFYFFGWRGIFYLLPGVFIMTFLATRSGVPFVWHFALLGTISCYVGFAIGRLICPVGDSGFNGSKWKFFLFVGTCSSIANGITLSLLRDKSLLEGVTAYVIGDVAGLMVTFYILILMFRYARNLPRLGK